MLELVTVYNLQEDFDENVRFSEITMTGHSGFQNYVVVGSAAQIKERLNRNNIQLLRD